jgi:hypothetical protein
MLLWPTFSSTTSFALGAVAAMTRLETRFGSWLPVSISTGMVELVFVPNGNTSGTLAYWRPILMARKVQVSFLWWKRFTGYRESVRA